MPELVVEAQAAAQGDVARLRRFDTSRLRETVRLVGLDDPGPPITVVVAAEDSELGRHTPHWIAGFAHPPGHTVVLFPARSLQYPHDSLEEVLHHEIAHVLIDRAAGGAPLPRWFSEGLATVAERQLGREDRRQLAIALTTRGPIAMADVDGWFGRGPPDASRAYAVSAAFVRDLLDVHGPEAAARVLTLVADGIPFAAAFARATGETLTERERAFDARMTTWERWVPLLTGPHVLWVAVTVLALLAIWRRRRTRAERRRRWADDEVDDEWDAQAWSDSALDGETGERRDP